MKIDLPIAKPEQKKYATVKAEIVDIAPHLAAVATFAITQPFTGAYRVYNVETGFAVLTVHPIRKECCAQAMRKLENYTPSSILQLMRDAERGMQ